MTLRERILSVYKGEIPDVMPYMLDVSHWFYHKHQLPWDLSISYDSPEYRLIDYHKQAGAGFYMPNLASFYSINCGDDINIEVIKEIQGNETSILWRYETPLGMIERRRVWVEGSYSWAIRDWSIKTESDLKILGYAMGNRIFKPRWDKYNEWVQYVGDDGVVYMPLGYSGIGYLLNYWMGIEGVMYAAADWPETMHEVVNQINGNTLDCVDLIAKSPAEIVIMGDNISSDVQPPWFFKEWSAPFYIEAIKRLHSAGKYVAVHIDGKLQDAIEMIRKTGADCADAVTPPPLGDLTPEECRREAGADFILSGGVSPDLWLPSVDIETFKKAVMCWIELRKQSPRLIASAGDQVPPNADEDRIKIMGDLVETYGRY